MYINWGPKLHYLNLLFFNVPTQSLQQRLSIRWNTQQMYSRASLHQRVQQVHKKSRWREFGLCPHQHSDVLVTSSVRQRSQTHKGLPVATLNQIQHNAKRCRWAAVSIRTHAEATAEWSKPRTTCVAQHTRSWAAGWPPADCAIFVVIYYLRCIRFVESEYGFSETVHSVRESESSFDADSLAKPEALSSRKASHQHHQRKRTTMMSHLTTPVNPDHSICQWIEIRIHYESEILNID